MGYSIGQVANASGVTVRTLHHYEQIGLLSASERSHVGYRFYDETDLERLQRILFYKELGFPLSDITTILDNPRNDAAAHLRRQHQMLRQRVKRLQAMVEAIEYEMEAQQMDVSLTPEERLELFGDFVPEDYEKEAEERWGNTEAYKQSMRRTKAYSKADWLAIKEEGAAIESSFKAAIEGGTAAESTEAMDLAEAHRQQITKWFYDCSYQIHTGLSQMYVDDLRFKKHYEDIAPGLAEYVRDAVVANASRGAE